MEFEWITIPTRVRPFTRIHIKTYPNHFPLSIHICITDVHTQDGIADQFVNDVKEQVAEIMKNPGQVVEGKMAIYGVSQGLPDRSLVGDFIKLFLDSLVFTPSQPHANGK